MQNRRHWRFVAASILSMAWWGMCEAVLSHSAEPCPKEVCNPGKTCSDILNFCSPEQEGEDCNGCDGSASIRLCSKSVQDRKCTKKDKATTCGNKFTGKCTKARLGYFYCKKSAAGGSHSCDQTECSGDTACTGS